MKALIQLLFLLAALHCLGQKKEPAVFNEMDQKAKASALNSGEFYDALYQADVAVTKMRRDSLHQHKLGQLKVYRKKYISTCEHNNKIYKRELHTLNKICSSETFSCKDLENIQFIILKVTVASEEGYCSFTLPNSDSARSLYKYNNSDSLCMAEPIKLTDYPGIIKAMAEGKISQMIVANGGTSVDTFPDAPRMAGVFPSEEGRTESFYEEHAAVLAVRIKTLLNKANKYYPEQGFPTYKSYSQHEQKSERTAEELANYRQGVLLYFTEKFESM